MISFDYLKYLIRSRKYLLLFILILTLLFSFVRSNRAEVSYVMHFIVALVQCFALPCLLFSYVHD